MATHLYIELQFMYVPKDKNHITYRGSITHILNFLNSTTTTIPPQTKYSTHITPYAFQNRMSYLYPILLFLLVLVLGKKLYGFRGWD